MEEILNYANTHADTDVRFIIPDTIKYDALQKYYMHIEGKLRIHHAMKLKMKVLGTYENKT